MTRLTRDGRVGSSPSRAGASSAIPARIVPGEVGR